MKNQEVVGKVFLCDTQEESAKIQKALAKLGHYLYDWPNIRATYAPGYIRADEGDFVCYGSMDVYDEFCSDSEVMSNEDLYKLADIVDESEEDYKEVDMVNNPSHYTSHPSGIEAIEVTRHMSFNLGNAMKYIWRCDLKKDAIEDLKKAVFYLNDEIKLRESNK